MKQREATKKVRQLIKFFSLLFLWFDPGSVIRDPGSEIRDQGWKKIRIRDPG